MIRRRSLLKAAAAVPFVGSAKAQMLQSIVNASGAASLPTGALGIWFADELDATNKLVPNSISSTPSTNLWRAPRRRFADSNYWNPSGGVTVTDAGVTAPDGSAQASTLVGTGDWSFFNGNYGSLIATTFPAGDYTLGVNVKRNTGSNQQFSFTANNTGTRSAAQTATSAWQRFTFTFNKGSNFNGNAGIGLCSIDGTTGANLQICDMELYAGTSDLGPGVLSADLYLGINRYDTNPVTAATYLDFGAGMATAIMQPTAPIGSVTAFTAIGLVKKAIASQTYPGFLGSGHGHDGQPAEFACLARNPASDVKYLNFDIGGMGLFDLFAAGDFHILTHRWDGTTSEIWIDDVLLNAVTDAFTLTLDDLFEGSMPYFSGALQVSAVGFWLRKLTDTEVRTTAGIFRDRFASTYFNRILIPTGDSITGSATFDYPYQATYSPAIFGSNRAGGGYTLASLIAQAASVDGAIPPDAAASRKFILTVLIGANDLEGIGGVTYPTIASYCVALAAYLDARRAAGFIVVICTILPRTLGGFNASRNSVNDEIRLWLTNGLLAPGVHADAICDFAADPTMGPDAAASDTTYYSDGLHPTSAGQLILAGVYGPVVNAL